MPANLSPEYKRAEAAFKAVARALRDALLPYPYSFTALNNANRNRQRVPVEVGGGRSGNPHAIGLWQQPGGLRAHFKEEH